MIYRHRFQVHSPFKRVAEFHSHSTSLAAITPPPIIIQMQHAPQVLMDGDQMEFTMWLGPFPIHWLARIEAVSSNGFTDRQLSGPLAEWVHQHTFVVVDEQTTEVVDEITLRLRSHPFWWLVGMGMQLSLPILFAYRAWKTRRTLQ